MSDVVVAAVALVGLLVLVLTVLAALTLVPFVVALQRADVLGVSPARVGALALGASVVALAVVAFALLRTDVSLWLAVLPILLTWALPAVLRVIPSAPRPLGRVGRHEAGVRR